MPHPFVRAPTPGRAILLTLLLILPVGLPAVGALGLGAPLANVLTTTTSGTPCDQASDNFGNTCEFVPYGFDDIRANGTAISLWDDSLSAAIPLPFNFTFYGNVKQNVFVSSNGFLTFLDEDEHGCCSGQMLPDSRSPNDLIAGVWGDLYPVGGEYVHYATLGADGNRTFIVQFTDVPYCCNASEGPYQTFQVKLLEATNAIEVHYASVASDSWGRITAGIENCQGTDGILLASGAWNFTQTAVRYNLAPGPASECAPNTPPSAFIHTPTEGSTVSGFFEVAGSAYDPDPRGNVTGIEVCLSTNVSYSCQWLVTSGANVSWSTTFNASEHPAGPAVLYASAYDGSRYGPTALVSIFLANGTADTAPTVEFLTPEAWSSVSGMVFVSGTAQDDVAVEAVYFGIYGEYEWMAQGTTTWNTTFDASFLADGWATLYAYAFDGTSYGPVTTRQVYVESGRFVDVAVVDVTVQRNPLRSDFGDAPNVVNELRTVRVTVRNDGNIPVPNGWLNVHLQSQARTPLMGFGSQRSLGGDSVYGIAPGESRTYEFPWDTTLDFGDVEVQASVWSYRDAEWSNNHASVSSFVRLGGAGGLVFGW